MSHRSVYSGGEEAGVVRLDASGNFRIEGPGAPEAPHAEPDQPPEPEIDVEALRQQAYQQGVEAGKQEAWQLAQQEIDALQQNMQVLIQSIPSELTRVLSEAEPQLLDLALSIAKKIIQTEVAQNPNVIAGVVHAALEQVQNQTIIAIHLNPDDVETLQPEFSDGRIELIPDSAVQRGGCRVETDLGELDATLETQWEMIERSMRENQPLTPEPEEPQKPASPAPIQQGLEALPQVPGVELPAGGIPPTIEQTQPTVFQPPPGAAGQPPQSPSPADLQQAAAEHLSQFSMPQPPEE